VNGLQVGDLNTHSNISLPRDNEFLGEMSEKDARVGARLQDNCPPTP
jgi:hypothetical protein